MGTSTKRRVFARSLRVLARVVLALATVGVLALVALRVAASMRETAIAADIAPSTGRFVSTAEGRLFVIEAGPPSAPPVLLFHGTAGWSMLWSETEASLAAAGFRAIAFDIPPFGFSDRDGDFDAVSQARRVSALLDALAIDRVILVGHSFGAGPAVEAAMRNPLRVSGLVLLDAALGLDANTGTKAPALLRSRPLREVAVSATVTNPLAMRPLLASFLARKEAATDEIAALLRRPLARRGTTEAIGAWLATFMARDPNARSAAPENYRQIRAPTAILWGEADTVTPLAQGEHLAGLIPGATLVTLPNVGHIPYLEDPATAIPAIVRAVVAVEQASHNAGPR